MINTELLTAVTLGIFLAGVLQTSIMYGIGKIKYRKRRALLDKEFADFKKHLETLQDTGSKEETK